MSKPKPKVIGYVRVSTDKQECSIEDQIKKIKAFCEFKEFDLVHVFEDPAVSARKVMFTQRDTGKAILKFLKEDPDVKYIVVRVQDRLFRNAADALVTTETLKEDYGVSLYIESEGDMVNLENPFQWLAFAIKAVFAQFEAMVIAWRTKNSLKSLKEKGKVFGRAPLGYKRNEDSTEFIPDEDELKVMAKVYRLKKEEDYSYAEIGKMLNFNNRYKAKNYYNAEKKRQKEEG